MISPSDAYRVVLAMVPLYVAMILGYASVKWWKIFSDEQCSGINRFFALFALPLLNFEFISTNDPYAMNYRFIGADVIQKGVVLGVLFVSSKVQVHGRVSLGLEWAITLYSLATLPNVLVVGIPLTKGMYGEGAHALIAQAVFMQCTVWNTVLLFLYEFRAARIIIAERFGEDSLASVVSSSTSCREGSVIDNISVEEMLAVDCEGGDVFQGGDVGGGGKNIDGNDHHPTTAKGVGRDSCYGQHTEGNRQDGDKLITLVWRKLSTNPNLYAGLVGLVWSLISFKFHVKMPEIVGDSVAILSRAGLGMAMFGLGLFMALQPRIIACGYKSAISSMSVRFVVGPAVMAAASLAVGLRGVDIQVAIVQAALPQSVATFVFAKEYNLHPEIMSTGVIIGMLIDLPITLVYYILMGLL